MALKIFHTADLHLGMKFTRGYAPEVQEALIQARFGALRSMVDTANERGCDLFVVAGDLFDTQRVPKRDVLRAAATIAKFDGRLALIMPGNHDYIQKGEDTLWARFREAMNERTVLLDTPKPYDLGIYDLDLTVCPGPCTAKHSDYNAVGWISEWPWPEDAKLKIGIAHGSMEGLSPDFNEDYYPMKPKDLEVLGMDLWLMGHTHVRYPDQDSGTESRILFPSTPEPDGFDCRHPGYAWLIELDDDGSIRYQSLRTGRYRFIEMEREAAGEGDLDSLKSIFGKYDPETHLVKLKLKGRVPGDVYDDRTSLIEELERHVLHLEYDLSELYKEITLADIDREFTQGSFPHKLLTKLAGSQRNALSLQKAYDLIREAGS